MMENTPGYENKPEATPEVHTEHVDIVSGRDLLQQLIESTGDVPGQTEIFAVKQYSVDESLKRAKRIIAAAGDFCGVAMDRADWVSQDKSTLVRLPLGGRAVIHHASGAVELKTGLRPMESLFAGLESKEALVRVVEATAERLGVKEWAGRDQLRFERLWQIKAAAGDRQRRIEPVLCRVVGAYRQVAGRLPVLGPASVAVKVASGGQLDAVSVLTRETAGEAIEWAPVLKPDQAARGIVGQLGNLMGSGKVPLERLKVQASMSFGYVAMGKRSSQRMLAPHYVAMVRIEGEEVQAYQLLVPATEKTYEVVCAAGSYAAPAVQRRAA